MRSILPVQFALLLSARAGDASIHGILGPQSGSVWKIDQKEDSITGLPTATAWIRTLNSTSSGSWDSRPVVLQLMCFKGSPIVRLHFQHRVGANRSATVAYRFDQKTGRDVSATFLPDFKTIIVEEKSEVEQFLSELTSSSRLLVRITSLYAGRTTAEFALTGAPDAIAAAYAPCPLKPETAGKRA